jgi:hypothetical protein
MTTVDLMFLKIWQGLERSLRTVKLKEVYRQQYPNHIEVRSSLAQFFDRYSLQRPQQMFNKGRRFI